MKDDMFIFDCVLHAYDVSDDNLLDKPGAELARAVSANGGGKNLPSIRQIAHGPDSETGFPNPYHRWTAEELYEIEFGGTSVDMAMAQTIPVFDWFEHGLAPVEANYEMSRLYPEQVLFAGGVDPNYHGEGVLDEMQRQVEEWGASAFKFYNAHIDDNSWRCDDEELAYPMYEKARELGIDLLQFHKGIPLGNSNIEDLRPNDLQRAARDFPDLNFVIYHLAVPYFAECVSIAARFPNVYLALGGNIQYGLIQPRVFHQQIGELLLHVGADKLFFGSEAPVLGGPEPYIDFILDLEIPDDLRENFGYPDFTMDAKRKFLGENFARVIGHEIPSAAPEAVA